VYVVVVLVVGDVIYQAVYDQVVVALRRNTCNCNIMAGKDSSADDGRVACNINRIVSYVDL
jgi:hypothetical protein